MKKILATTALALVLAGGSVASFAATVSSYQAQPTDITASDFINSRIYATESVPTGAVQVGAEKDWSDVGEINDVVLGRDGQVKAVILGVGGFLGIGEKDVAVPMQDVTFVKNGDGPNDYFLVINATKDTLTNAPAYVSAEEKMDQQQAANDAAQPMTNDTQAMNNDTMAADTTTDTNAVAPTDDTTTASTTGATTTRTPLVRPEITRDGYAAMPAAELTADKLQGATVYGPKDEDVGEINRIILDPNGKVERVVLDVGGFLGIGERQIAVTMDELNIVKNTNGDDFRVYIDATEANLKAQPEYKG